MRPTRHRVSVARLVIGGLAATLLAALAGAGIEVWRFGRTDAAAAARAEAEVRGTFAEMTQRVRDVARHVAADGDVPPAITAESLEASRRLFDIVAGARQGVGDRASLIAITIYDAHGTARAWAGRPSDLFNDNGRTPGALFSRPSLFVTPSPLGLRLVYIEPLTSPPAAGGSGALPRVGSVAVEHVLSPAPAASTISSTSAYLMPTRVVSVALRPRFEGAGDRPGRDAFLLTDTDGAPLVEGSVSPAALSRARAAWRGVVEAVCVALLGATLLLVAGPLLDRRSGARTPRAEILLTLGTVTAIAGGAAVLWLAYRTVEAPGWKGPLRLLVWGGAGAAITATAVSGAVRLRLALRTDRRWPHRERVLFAIAQLTCGIVLTALLAGFELLLGRAIDPAAIDLRHFSLHPWSAPRLAVLAGILLCHAAALWAGTLGCIVALARWRLPHRITGWHVAAFVLWVAPLAAAAVYGTARPWPVPGAAILLGGIACAVAALLGPRLALWYRHTTAVSRILALFMAFLLPALLIYPSIHFFEDRSTRELITTRYAVEAMDHPKMLLQSLRRALDEIDQQPLLAALVEETSGATPEAPRTGSAFAVWNKTVIARARLTSAVELYDRDGRLVSRFALSFPQYTGTAQKPQSVTGCNWDVFAEAQPFGAEERRMLLAERAICRDGVPVGSIIVHIVFDYRTLPFISSQSPYFEILRSQGANASVEGQPAGDVDVVVYGWGLRPIYTSGGSAWPLDEATFARVYASRTPFWTTLERDESRFEVYISNDRAGIYAIGYQVPGAFEHLVRLAELTTLAGAAYVLVLIGNALFTRIARDQPRTGRAVLREIRASFYRKLFLAFVLASIVPVLTLALVIRAYFANLLFDGIAGEAARTAMVAQRVIEESGALLRRGADVVPLTDDVMVWISQVINQDVNIFNGPELFVTSERDLFESGLLPTRTPDDVYRAVGLSASRASSARIGSGRCPTCSPRPRCAPRAATPSSPSRSRCASRKSSARSTSSIAACTSRRCSSSCLAPRSACRWRSGSPTRCAASPAPPAASRAETSTRGSPSDRRTSCAGWSMPSTAWPRS